MDKVYISSPPVVEIQPDGFTAKIIKPLLYIINGKEYRVASGWITDWASVPRFFWRVFPPMGKWTLAAILHDYLYRFRIGSREDADRLFLILMKHLEVSFWRRWAMYYAVRMFGKSSWHENRLTITDDDV